MKNILNLIFTAAFTVFAIHSDAQCFDDGHSPFQNQGWESCSTSIGPIPERGDAHWIMYNFGEVYAIDSTFFWNHNAWGETGKGVKSILIDYSTDQEDWTTVGPFTIDRAPGSWKYTGTTGPSLQNAEMQYLLITVISTWDDGESCAGLSEVKFNIGTPVATEEVELTQVNISPNPASERIQLTIPEYDMVKAISIFNSVGQKISDVHLPSGEQLILPIAELKDGMYFVSLYTVDGVNTESFVKMSR